MPERVVGSAPLLTAAGVVVRGFLEDVRSAVRPDLASKYLAARVRAHQGPPGSGAPVLTRTPGGYADHVREMAEQVGPWRFEVLDLVETGAIVSVRWRQVGLVHSDDGDRPVELGRAVYRVEDDRIVEYWLDITTTIESAG